MEKVDDLKEKYSNNNDTIQQKYFSVVYITMHSIFIILIALLLIFMEILISSQSTFITQIVDSTCSTGITLGLFYLFTAILQLVLGK